MKIRYIIISLLLWFLTLNFSSCSNKDSGLQKEQGSYKDYSKIAAGSVNYYSNNKVKIITDLEANSVLSDDEEGALIKYIKENNVYLREKKEGNSVNLILGSNKKEIIIEKWKNLNYVKLSPKGDKVFYNKYADDGSFSLGYYDTSSSKFNELKTNTLISGNLYEWKDNENLIYYGVNNANKLNGIFQYNLKTNEEKLLLEIKKGIIEFLYNDGNDIIYLTSDFNGNKNLCSFNYQSSKIQVLSTEVQSVSNLVISDKKIYILGKRTNSTSSVYLLNNGVLKRVIYDFPKNIDLEKGIEADSKGNILFIGYDETSEKEDVYLVDVKDQSVRLESKKSGEYYFIETN